MNFLERANELFDEMVECRRHIHRNAECGMELPLTVEYVSEKLRSYGYEPKPVAGGIVCTVGSGERTMLLRGDMDALPQTEVSGVPFACETGACHSCGHDMHTTMLLGAAKMLKECESELKGTIKLMFQPGEELLEGAKAMIKAGVLENPVVDCAMAIHCYPGDSCSIRYSHGRAMGASVFRILVHGKESHGARPYEGVSAAAVASEILLAGQRLVSNELQEGNGDIVTFGIISSGSASNIVPGEAVLEGSIRSYENDNIAFLKRRLEEIAQNIAAANRATAEVVYLREVRAFQNDRELVDQFAGCFEALTRKCVFLEGNTPGSEDFAEIGALVPSMLVNIGVGSPEEGYIWGPHNPHRIFSEEALKTGAACYAACAHHSASGQ